MKRKGLTKSRSLQDGPSRLAKIVVEKCLSHDEDHITRLVSQWNIKARAAKFDEKAIPHIVQFIRNLLSSTKWRDCPVEQRTQKVAEAIERGMKKALRDKATAAVMRAISHDEAEIARLVSVWLSRDNQGEKARQSG